jgi:hypothetical protein
VSFWSTQVYSAKIKQDITDYADARMIQRGLVDFYATKIATQIAVQILYMGMLIQHKQSL